MQKGLKSFSFILLALLCTPLFADLRYPELNEEGLTNLETIRKKLRAECPHSTCLVVFIGRSNVLISAYFEAKNFKNHVSLPGTNLRAPLSASNMLLAQQNFNELILTPFLAPKIEGRNKIIVVDYSHTGVTLARSAAWIHSFARTHGVNQTGILYYGVPLQQEHAKQLSSLGIKQEFISLGGSRQVGSLTYLASDSRLSDYAPYGSWEPLKDNTTPKIDPNRRNNYPYYEEDGQKKYNQYASYNDLIEAFESTNPLSKMYKPAHSCKGMLGGGDIL